MDMKMTLMLTVAGVGLLAGCAAFDRNYHEPPGPEVYDPAGAEIPHYEWIDPILDPDFFPTGVYTGTATDKNINRPDSFFHLFRLRPEVLGTGAGTPTGPGN
jgi:hypothetical protein